MARTDKCIMSDVALLDPKAIAKSLKECAFGQGDSALRSVPEPITEPRNTPNIRK